MFDENINDQQLETMPEIEAPEIQEEVAQAAPQESPQERNFRAIKERAERAERERAEALRYAEELRNRYERPQVQTQDDDEELNVNPDDIVEGKHIQKIVNKYKKLEDKIKQYEKQSYNSSAESRVYAKYPDFNKVVTHENLIAFSAMYPELAKAIDSSNDLYSKAVSTYELIKKYNISDEENTKANKDLIMKNLNRPKPAAAISGAKGDSPLSRANAFANGLTPELKAALRKEMEDAMNKPRSW